MYLERVAKYTLIPVPLSKDEKLSDIGYNISIGNPILDVNSAAVSHLIYYDRLSQDAAATLFQEMNEAWI